VRLFIVIILVVNLVGSALRWRQPLAQSGVPPLRLTSPRASCRSYPMNSRVRRGVYRSLRDQTGGVAPNAEGLQRRLTGLLASPPSFSHASDR
jgi:hypothetical protein